MLSLAFNTTGAVLASGGRDGVLRLWDTATYAALAEERIESEDTILALTFTAENQLVVGSFTGLVTMWTVSPDGGIALAGTGTGHTAYVADSAVSADGMIAATGSGDGGMIVWRWDAMPRLVTRRIVPPGPASAVAYSPDGNLVAVAYQSNDDEDSSTPRVATFDVETGGLVREFEPHPFGVDTLVFSADGTRVAASGGDLEVPVWDVATGELLATITDISAYTMAFTAEGRLAIFDFTDGRVVWWDPDRNRLVAELRLDDEQQERFYFDLDAIDAAAGATLVAGVVEEGYVVVVGPSVDGLQEQFRIAGGASTVAFSPSGNLLAVAGTYRVRLVDVVGQEVIGEISFLTYSEDVALAFSGDESTIAIGRDELIELWSVDDPVRMGQLELEHDAPFPLVASPPVGWPEVIVASEDRLTIDRWNLDTDEWRTMACRLTGRNLSPEEWLRYLPEETAPPLGCPEWPTGISVPASSPS